MTADEYWRQSPFLAEGYRKADALRKRRQNEVLWLQGLYIYDAFSVTMANAFKKKGARAVKYPEEPYDIGKKTKAEKEAKRRKEQEKIRKHFENMRSDWIAHNQSKNTETDGPSEEVTNDGR